MMLTGLTLSPKLIKQKVLWEVGFLKKAFHKAFYICVNLCYNDTKYVHRGILK